MLSAPVGDSARSHGIGGFAFEGIDNRDLMNDLVRVLTQFAVFDQIGHQRMQAIDRDELFREIERRAEVIDAAVGVHRFW